MTLTAGVRLPEQLAVPPPDLVRRQRPERHPAELGQDPQPQLVLIPLAAARRERA